MNEITPELRTLLSPLIGLPLVALKIGEHNSLSLMFSSDKLHNEKAQATYRLGTWHEGWKIFDQYGNLLLSRTDTSAVPDIDFGAYEDIEMSKGKVRLRLSHGHYVEFADRNMDDDIFYAFLSEHVFVGYATKTGWRHGRSDRPWTGGEPI
jgi:hypothetical protein